MDLVDYSEEVLIKADFEALNQKHFQRTKRVTFR
jgi:hypothetical protein